MTIPALAAALRQEISLLSKYLRQHTPSARHLSLTETTVLSLLQQHESLLASELAGLTQVTPPSMSQVVQQLLARQLIARQPSPHDKRKQFVRLTPAGQAVVATARRERDAWLTAAIGEQLSAEEQRLLAAALPLLQRLSAAARPASPTDALPESPDEVNKFS